MWAVFLFRHGERCKHAKIPFAPPRVILHQSALFCTAAHKIAPPVELIPQFYYYLLCNTNKALKTLSFQGFIFCLLRSFLEGCYAICYADCVTPFFFIPFTKIAASPGITIKVEFVLKSSSGCLHIKRSPEPVFLITSAQCFFLRENSTRWGSF